jgi:hypothetical protein
MIKLIEIYRSDARSSISDQLWSVREVQINPSHILRFMEYGELNHTFDKNSIGLSDNHSFTRIDMTNGISMVVVASVEQILEKLNTSSKKKMLHG